MIGSPGIPQIAASFSTIVPRTGFPGNHEALPQFEGPPSMPKPCRAAKYVAFAVIATHTLFAQGWCIMELNAIASLNMLAIMFSGVDQREEAFAAAPVSCMRPVPSLRTLSRISAFGSRDSLRHYRKAPARAIAAAPERPASGNAM
jgi:hypothetical protein